MGGREMRYVCPNRKCPRVHDLDADLMKFAGMELDEPRFTEVRRATYEINEDGDTLGLLDWADEPLEPVKCAHCGTVAKQEPPTAS